MAVGYSMDLRRRVIDAVDQGMSVTRAAEIYQITRPTIYDWLRLRRATGNVQPRPFRPGRKRKLDSYRDAILKTIEQNSDLTLEGLREQLKLPVCVTTLWSALRRWGISLKKSSPSH